MTQPVLEDRRPSIPRLVGFALLLTAVSWGLGAFAAFPWVASDPDAAVVRVAFKHVAEFEHAGARLSTEEIEKLPRHMRPQNLQRAPTGRRVPTGLRVVVDGRRLLDKEYSPGGLRHDGPTFGYEELAVSPGRHLLEARLADHAPEHAAPRQWQLEQEVDLQPGQALLVEFSEDGGLRIR